MAAVGFQFNGRGFAISNEEALEYIRKTPEIARHLRPFVNGVDITQRPRHLWMFDFHGLTEAQLSRSYNEAYQHLLVTVKPERDVNPRPARRRNWWIFGEALAPFRGALNGLSRIIVTPITSKHRIFTFLGGGAGGDSNVVMVACDDAYVLSVLSSRAHRLWAVKAGTRRGIGNHPRYNKGRCLDAFPFPDKQKEDIVGKLRQLGEDLDALRGCYVLS